MRPPVRPPRLRLAPPYQVYSLSALNSNEGPIIRIGGTAADSSFYVPDAPSPSDGQGRTLISDATLDAVFALAAQTHSTVLWNFNGLSFRDPATMGPWDPANATALLATLHRKWGGAIKWSFSLGNEPGARAVGPLERGRHRGGGRLATPARPRRHRPPPPPSPQTSGPAPSRRT